MSKQNKVDFNALVNYIIDNTGYVDHKTAVEKEVLHYDILAALDSDGFLKDLVFQGGTSLRLCRGSSRFSEDLDFAGGKDFTSSNFQDIKACIEKALGERYGLNIYVKQPSDISNEPGHENIKVSKWRISVETSPGFKNIPRQKIKVEIANVPAHTEELLPIIDNYPVLGQGRSPVLIRTETLDEVLADKVVAFPISVKKIRHRDLWDIPWLQQQGAKLNPELVKIKLKDYNVSDEVYKSLLLKSVQDLPQIIDSKDFKEEMKRFINKVVAKTSLDKPGFTQYLTNENLKVFKLMLMSLQPEQSSKMTPEFEFKM
jgi:predicted nucleotidyltransferase component of viral defense system